MSLLYKLLHGQVCKSTHHKLVVDALMGVSGHACDVWQSYLLSEYRVLLDGAKLPDTQFRDFKNHVLHTSENNWGGAITAAQDWFQKAVKLCREKRWSEGVSAIGVLTHYVSDPFMPLHTGQTEAEGVIHRACEWSVTRSYDQLKTILETEMGGVTRAKKQSGDQWLQQLIIQGAQKSHKHYDEIVARYDLKRGSADPVAGLDQVSRRLFAKSIGECLSALTLVFEKVIEQVTSVPPNAQLTAEDILKQENISQSWIKKNLQDKEEQHAAMKILDEVQSRGKAVHALSQECQDVRRLHAEQVLKTSIGDLDQAPITLPGQRYGQADSRFFSQNQSIEKFLTISLPGSGAESVFKTRKYAPGEVREVSRFRKTLELSGKQSRLRGVDAGEVKRRSINNQPTATATVSTQNKFIAPAIQPQNAKHEIVEGYAESSPYDYMRRDNQHTEFMHELPLVDSHPRKTRTDRDHSINNRTNTRGDRRKVRRERQNQSITEQEFSGQTAAQHGTLSPRLTLESPLVDAPSIGPKTARRFTAMGIKTVGQFLQADVQVMAEKMHAGHITSQVLADWQIQSRWATILPKFRGADAQSFVALNYREPRDLMRNSPQQLHQEITEFIKSKEGARITRDSQPPKYETVQLWLEWASKVQERAA
jgi:hypothetical protein